MTNLLTTIAATAIILSKSEQIELVAFATSPQCDDKIRQEARRRLVQSNIRLAHKVAKKHIRTGLAFNDLLACATEGILIAIDVDARQVSGARPGQRRYPSLWVTHLEEAVVLSSEGT